MNIYTITRKRYYKKLKMDQFKDFLNQLNLINSRVNESIERMRIQKLSEKVKSLEELNKYLLQVSEEKKKECLNKIQVIFLDELKNKEFNEKDSNLVSCANIDDLVKFAKCDFFTENLQNEIYNGIITIVSNKLTNLSVFEQKTEQFKIVQKCLCLYDFLNDIHKKAMLDLINMHSFRITIKDDFYIGPDFDINGNGVYTLRKVKKGSVLTYSSSVSNSLGNSKPDNMKYLDPVGKTIMYIIVSLSNNIRMSDYIFDVSKKIGESKWSSCFSGSRSQIPEVENYLTSHEFKHYLQHKLLDGFMSKKATCPKIASSWIIDYDKFISLHGYSVAPITTNQNNDFVINDKLAPFVNHFNMGLNNDSRARINSKFNNTCKDGIYLEITKTSLQENEKVLCDYGKDFEFVERSLDYFKNSLKDLITTRVYWTYGISFLSIILGTELVQNLDESYLKNILDILFSSTLFKKKIILTDFEIKILNDIYETDFLKEKVSDFIINKTKKKMPKVNRKNLISIGDMIAIFDPVQQKFIFYIVKSAGKNRIFVNIDWTDESLVKFHGSILEGVKLGKNISEEIRTCDKIGEEFLKNATTEYCENESNQYFYIQSSVFDCEKKKFPKRISSKKCNNIIKLTEKCYSHNQNGEKFVVDIMKILNIDYELNENLVSITSEQDINDFLLERSKSNNLEFENCSSSVSKPSNSESRPKVHFSISDNRNKRIEGNKITKVGTYNAIFGNFESSGTFCFKYTESERILPLKFIREMTRYYNGVSLNERKRKIFSFEIKNDLPKGNCILCKKTISGYTPVPVVDYSKLDIEILQSKSTTSLKKSSGSNNLVGPNLYVNTDLPVSGFDSNGILSTGRKRKSSFSSSERKKRKVTISPINRVSFFDEKDRSYISSIPVSANQEEPLNDQDLVIRFPIRYTEKDNNGYGVSRMSFSGYESKRFIPPPPPRSPPVYPRQHYRQFRKEINVEKVWICPCNNKICGINRVSNKECQFCSRPRSSNCDCDTKHYCSICDYNKKLYKLQDCRSCGNICYRYRKYCNICKKKL